MKHSPGPWVAKYQEETRTIINAPGWIELATVYGTIPNGIEEGRANAMLIAAAPELFDALDALGFYMDDYYRHRIERDSFVGERDGLGVNYISNHTKDIDLAIKAMRAALSKAKGIG